MKKTSQETPELIRNDEDLSLYGRFHRRYLGYEFKHRKTGRIYSKGEFWDAFREEAQKLMERKIDIRAIPLAPSDFELITYVRMDNEI